MQNRDTDKSTYHTAESFAEISTVHEVEKVLSYVEKDTISAEWVQNGTDSSLQAHQCDIGNSASTTKLEEKR